LALRIGRYLERQGPAAAFAVHHGPRSGYAEVKGD